MATGLDADWSEIIKDLENTSIKKKVRKADPNRNSTKRDQERAVVGRIKGKPDLYRAGFYMTDDRSKTIMRTTKWVRIKRVKTQSEMGFSRPSVPSDRLKYAAGGSKLFKGAGKSGWSIFFYGGKEHETQKSLKEHLVKDLKPVLKRTDLKRLEKEARKACREKGEVYDRSIKDCRARKVRTKVDVKAKRKECREDGKVYSTETGKCRAPKVRAKKQ